jgi:hypothetical protein
VNGATRREKEQSVGGGAQGAQWQRHFVRHGGRGGCTASEGPARGEWNRAGPKRNSDFLFIQIIFK